MRSRQSRWTNPPDARSGIRRRGVYCGTEVNSGREVRLALPHFATGTHLVGPPGSGKSRILLWLIQQFCRVPGACVIVINPKGGLARQTRDWALSHGQTKRLVWFSPGESGPIPSWNPLAPNGLPVATHAKAVRESLLSAWGQHSLDQTAQLARYLYLGLACARYLKLTLAEALQLLQPGSSLRRSVLPRITDPYLHGALSYLDQRRPDRQDQLVASTLARLEAFIMDPLIRSILTQQKNSLNFGHCIKEGSLFLANVEHYRPLRPDDVRLLTRLLINDVLAHVFALPPKQRRKVFLVIDEVHTVATEDLCVALELGRELGLNTVAAHQYMHQLDEEGSGRLRHALLNCARTRVVFGGLSVAELEPLARELMLDQFDPWEIKDELTSLECEPVEKTAMQVGQTTSWGTTTAKTVGTSQAGTLAKSGATTEGEADTTSWQEGLVESSGHSLSSGLSNTVPAGSGVSAGEGLETSSAGSAVLSGRAVSSSQGGSFGRSRADTEGWSVARTRGQHQAQSEQQAQGGSRTVTWVPTHGFVKRRVVSSRTYLSESEFLTLQLQEIQPLPQAHFVMKTPGHRALFVRGPWVATPFAGKRCHERGMGRVYELACYATPEEVAIEETARVAELEATAAEEVKIMTAPRRRRRRPS